MYACHMADLDFCDLDLLYMKYEQDNHIQISEQRKEGPRCNADGRQHSGTVFCVYLLFSAVYVD
jgi:hypothetical protein